MPPWGAGQRPHLRPQNQVLNGVCAASGQLVYPVFIHGAYSTAQGEGGSGSLQGGRCRPACYLCLCNREMNRGRGVKVGHFGL